MYACVMRVRNQDLIYLFLVLGPTITMSTSRPFPFTVLKQLIIFLYIYVVIVNRCMYYNFSCVNKNTP